MQHTSDDGRRSTLILGVVLVSFSPVFSHAAPPVRHPNLLLDREEIAQIKDKIARYPWATDLFEKNQQFAATSDAWPVSSFGGKQLRAQALCYVITGERAQADRVRADLLAQARDGVARFENRDASVDPVSGFNVWQGAWASDAWAYDLTYDTFSDEERRLIERWLRDVGKVIMEDYKLQGTTPNLMFVMHFNAGLVGYCLGDQELIEWALHDPGKYGPQCGGFYPVMDSIIKDKLFWGEAPLYGLDVDLHGMLALAEAALHYDGTDLYRYVSPKSGGSLKNLLDGYLRMGFPLERTGIRGGALRIATFGDGSISYGPTGTMRDEYLTDEYFMSDLEIGYKRYRDPGYAWVLSLNPARDAATEHSRAPIWGTIALTHGEPLPADLVPPPAPSGIYPGQGFAMVRADESPAFWSQGGLAAMMKLGSAIGHGHSDYYELVLHGKGRLLYPDLQAMTYESPRLGWSNDGIGHSTLLVDGQSPRPGDSIAAQDFTPEVKFVAISGSAFDFVKQTRRLLMTREYLADIFHASDQERSERVFDWVQHGLGRLYPANPGAYRPTNALLADYWWVSNERGRPFDGTWQVDWIQRSAGINPALQFGKEWFDHQVGVRMTMVGTPGTEAYLGDGPITNGPPYGRIDGDPEGSVPLVVVRRRGVAATYAAVHEPYEGAPRIKQVRRLAETAEAVALAITAPEYTDYVMTAFDDQPHSLITAEGEVFTFTEYGYLRMAGGHIAARGKLTALRLRAEALGGATAVTLDGRAQPLRREGDFAELGELPRTLPSNAPAAVTEDPAERAASLHYYFLPEEVHLSAEKAGDERQVELHLRAVGPGEITGVLEASVREGVRVTPSRIEVAPLREGEERIVPLTVRAADHARKALYPIAFVPAGMPAAPQTLLASVGVVMTLDRRIPEMKQYVVRSPGYTIKVDVRSGVSYYLLDADGHRRHGGLYNSNFQFGIPGVEGAARYGTPCGFVWEGDNSLTIGADPARLRYTFHEDRMVFALVPPTDPRRTFTMWLGTFDRLGKPVHKGQPEAGHQHPTYVADWLFFPHGVYRQGVLIIPPPQTPVSCPGEAMSFPLKEGQEVTLKFATQEEVERLK
jgi:hypothetical protein